MSFAAAGMMNMAGGGLALLEYLKGTGQPIFNRGQARGISSALGDFLLERIGTDPVDTPSFGRMNTALREGLRGQGNAAIQGLTETAQARGFQDSGELVGGIQNIRRGEIAGFASGTRDILEMLEARRLEGVLPFLGMATGEQFQSGALQQSRLRTFMGGAQGVESVARGITGRG